MQYQFSGPSHGYKLTIEGYEFPTRHRPPKRQRAPKFNRLEKPLMSYCFMYSRPPSKCNPLLLFFRDRIDYGLDMERKLPKKKSAIPEYIKKLTHDSVPASVGLVKMVREELCARFDKVDARFVGVDARFASMDARFDGMDAKFTGMFNEVLVSVHRTQVLMEEQRSENRIVLDGIKNVLERMDRVEEEQRDLRRTLRV